MLGTIFYLKLLFLIKRTAQKKISIKEFLSKCDQILSLRRIRSHLLKKLLMETVTFCAVALLFGIINFNGCTIY